MIGLAAKKDFFLVSIIGLLFGALLLPILENIRPAFWKLNLTNAAGLIIGFSLFANFALAIAGILGKKFFGLWQFAKFGAGGALSAALDIGILNLLSFIFQIFSGSLIVVFNSVSIAMAMTNSYIWNKLWTFKKRGITGPIFEMKEFGKFLAATFGSLILGSLMVYIMTTAIGAPGTISTEVWENIAKLTSLPLVVTWNFVAYKFFVFKS